MLAKATFSLAEIFFSTVWLGQSSSIWVIMEALLKITAVASGPNPRRPTYLLVGLDLVPPRFLILWYIVRVGEPGALAMMMESMSLMKLVTILAPKSVSGEMMELTEKLARFLFASSFEGRDW